MESAEAEFVLVFVERCEHFDDFLQFFVQIVNVVLEITLDEHTNKALLTTRSWSWNLRDSR